MKSFLNGAQLAVQSLINSIFQARDRSVQAETTATEKAGEAASSASQALTARDQSRRWAEGLDVIGLPDSVPTSKSSKLWSEESKTYRDHAQGWAEGADVTKLPGATPQSRSSKAWNAATKLLHDATDVLATLTEQHAARAAGVATSAVYAQRVFGASPIDWYDLAAAKDVLQEMLTNCHLDHQGGSGHIYVQSDLLPWQCIVRIDLAAEPGTNPLYLPGSISYRLEDLAGLYRQLGVGNWGISLELLNAAEAVVRVVDLIDWRGTTNELILEANDVRLPVNVRYVRLSINGQGGLGGAPFPLGAFAAGPFQTAGYLTQSSADVRYRRRVRARSQKALPYTLSPADDGALIELTGSGALTLPQGTSLTGRAFTLLNASGGAVGVVGGTGVTVRHASGGANPSIRAGGTAIIIYGRLNEVWISGDIS